MAEHVRVNERSMEIMGGLSYHIMSSIDHEDNPGNTNKQG